MAQFLLESVQGSGCIINGIHISMFYTPSSLTISSIDTSLDVERRYRRNFRKTNLIECGFTKISTIKQCFDILDRLLQNESNVKIQYWAEPNASQDGRENDMILQLKDESNKKVTYEMRLFFANMDEPMAAFSDTHLSIHKPAPIDTHIDEKETESKEATQTRVLFDRLITKMNEMESQLQSLSDNNDSLSKKVGELETENKELKMKFSAANRVNIGVWSSTCHKRQLISWDKEIITASHDLFTTKNDNCDIIILKKGLYHIHGTIAAGTKAIESQRSVSANIRHGFIAINGKPRLSVAAQTSIDESMKSYVSILFTTVESCEANDRLQIAIHENSHFRGVTRNEYFRLTVQKLDS